jgi:hypothetical protein
VSTRPREQRSRSVRTRDSGCIFQAYGKDFDVEAFLPHVSWRPRRGAVAPEPGPASHPPVRSPRPFPVP